MSNIDPSTVKAGDTVTVTGAAGGARPHYEISGIAWEPDHSPGTLWVGPVCISAPLVTLTAHQPAPEPEPEWKPGTPAEGTVNGETVRGLIGHNDNNDGDVFVYWNGTARHVSLTGTVPADARPLVVIDPAKIDHLALLDAAAKAWEANSNDLPPSILGMVAHAIVTHLGIEATS